MIKYDFTNLQRISKTKAKQMYEAGFDVLFIPCKLNPENNFYSLRIWENKFLWGQYKSFEELYNAFSFFNCNYETGYYPAFYMRKEKTLIHFQFINGSNPYIFTGTPLECFSEIKKWNKNWNINCIQSGFYILEEK